MHDGDIPGEGKDLFCVTNGNDKKQNGFFSGRRSGPDHLSGRFSP